MRRQRLTEHDCEMLARVEKPEKGADEVGGRADDDDRFTDALDRLVMRFFHSFW